MNIQNELEKRRKTCLGYNAVFIIFIIISFLFFPFLGFISFLLFALDLLFFIFVVRKKSAEYRKFYKENVVKSILKEFFDDLFFDPAGGISKEAIDGTDMMMLGNSFSSNDYISGRYKDIRFEQSDVLIQDVRSTGKQTTTVTYFQGRWMIFEFNKKFVYDMQISEKSFLYSKHKNSLFASKEERFKKIEFEDEAFNSVFTTYAKNEHEAYYIVTPHFMQNLMHFNNAVSGDLLLCFVDNKLHLALNNRKDAFEPSVFKKVELAFERERILNDLSVIIKFVETLRLDNDLFA